MTMGTQMTLTEFVDGLALYGADLNRWPTDQRLAAQTLLTTSPSAQAEHAAFAALDQALSLPATPVIDARRLEGLIFNTMAQLDRPVPGVATALDLPPPHLAEFGLRRSLFSLMMVATAMLGIVTGVSTTLFAKPQQAETLVQVGWAHPVAPTLSELLNR